MADSISIAGITGAVASAVAQEVMGRAVSFMLGAKPRVEEPPPPPPPPPFNQGHEAERLKMALCQLASALECTGKVPITDASLLDHRKTFKLAYAEGSLLLDKHLRRLQAGGRNGVQRGDGEDDDEGTGGRVPKRRRWIAAAKKLLTGAAISPSSSAGLSACAVRRFEWLADCAGSFVRDVESGCALRHFTFCSPLVRHLLAGRHLRYEARPRRRGGAGGAGRGVETVVEYHYRSAEAPERSFLLQFVLRLSESTDLFGTAIRCLQAMSEMGLANVGGTAVGELALLAGLHDVCLSTAPPWLHVDEGEYMRTSHAFRRDPVCCRGNNGGGHGASFAASSSEMSRIFPEQIIVFTFWCCIPAAALECSSRSTREEGDGRAGVATGGYLKMAVLFLPHACQAQEEEEEEEQGSWALDVVEDNLILGDVCIQQAAEMLRSKAPKCFARQPEMTLYAVGWGSNHGSAMFMGEKPSAAGDGDSGCAAQNLLQPFPPPLPPPACHKHMEEKMLQPVTGYGNQVEPRRSARIGAV
ncbi:hypothetical protein U9M48_037083 [Paspalum notatum var. saurae]|uniref:Uncharacterized protein n=1 Tax=Paspalum notatum var. saurae TaxID=547442 RepID=A0AAQ3X9K6_PASNO